MSVAEFIELLRGYPQDAMVTQNFCSDLEAIEVEHISFHDGRAEYAATGKGAIDHNGHLMILDKNWWPQDNVVKKYGDRPAEPRFISRVHIRGN